MATGQHGSRLYVMTASTEMQLTFLTALLLVTAESAMLCYPAPRVLAQTAVLRLCTHAQQTGTHILPHTTHEQEVEMTLHVYILRLKDAQRPKGGCGGSECVAAHSPQPPRPPHNIYCPAAKT